MGRMRNPAPFGLVLTRMSVSFRGRNCPDNAHLSLCVASDTCYLSPTRFMNAQDSALDERPMSKILLAEDDNDMRRFLVRALQNAGFDVVSFDNGLAAYQRLREEPFELLLTDIVMPEMDGIELARRAAELDPDIKIMFITGFAAVALNADSAAPKHAKVLSKPVHLRDLVNEVNKMLAA